MKTISTLVVVAFLGCGLFAAQTASAQTQPPTKQAQAATTTTGSQIKKASYGKRRGHVADLAAKMNGSC